MTYGLYTFAKDTISGVFDYFWKAEKDPALDAKTAQAFQTYSCKGLPASIKMQKQLICALQDSNARAKSETTAFTIKPPKKGFSSKLYSASESAVAQHQGSRPHQEDGYLEPTEICFQWKGEEKKGTFFGVFDGHGDNGNLSSHLQTFLQPELQKLLTAASETAPFLNDEVIGNTFVKLFHNLSQSYRETSHAGGATVTCGFRLDNTIYFPNIGDSRTILITPDAEYQLTEDAVVSNPRFQSWHRNKGYKFIHVDHALRVNPNIPSNSSYPMMARDVSVYPWMCSRPKITKIRIGDGISDPQRGILYSQPGDFLLLASDGLYEPALLPEVAEEVRKLTQKQVPLPEIATQLVHTAGSYRGNDNVTAMIIAI